MGYLISFRRPPHGSHISANKAVDVPFTLSLLSISVLFSFIALFCSLSAVLAATISLYAWSNSVMRPFDIAVIDASVVSGAPMAFDVIFGLRPRPLSAIRVARESGETRRKADSRRS